MGNLSHALNCAQNGLDFPLQQNLCRAMVPYPTAHFKKYLYEAQVVWSSKLVVSSRVPRRPFSERKWRNCGWC